MRGHRCSAGWIAGLGLLMAQVAYGGRPMTTDDASITPIGQCQVQAWIQADRQVDAGWLLPACSPLSGTEITAGGALYRSDSGNYSLGLIQIKFLLRDQAPGSWGAAVSAGWSRSNSAVPADRVHVLPLNLIASYRASDESYLVHVDVGARRDQVLHTTQGTWGVAFERAPNARFGGFIEAFGVTRESPTVQTGIRYDLVPQRVSMNVTLGARWRNGLREPFLSIGVNL